MDHHQHLETRRDLPHPTPIEEVSPLRYGLAGGISGLAMESILHPIDTVRTNMQSNYKEYVPFKKQFKSIHSQYGYKGLYRGLTGSITGGFTANTAQFYIYEVIKKQLNKLDNMPKEVSPFISAFFGGLISDFIYIPCDLIRTRMQLGTFTYKNVFDGAWQIYRTEGLRRLYLGGGIFLLADCFHTSFTFGLYEIFKILYRPYFEQQKNETNIKHTILSSVSATCISAMLTNPLDVCGTRVQMVNTAGNKKPETLIQLIPKIYKNEGFIGFMKGVSGRVSYYGLSYGILFPLYEFLKLKFGIDLED